MLESKELAGPSEARLHFVEGQEDAVPIAESFSPGMKRAEGTI
jgi:hypothetical protein